MGWVPGLLGYVLSFAPSCVRAKLHMLLRWFSTAFVTPCVCCVCWRGVLATDNWSMKAKRRKVQGTGRMRHLSSLARRFKNGFRERTVAQSAKKTATA